MQNRLFSQYKVKGILLLSLFSLLVLAGCTNTSTSTESPSKSEMKENEDEVLEDEFTQLESKFDARLGVYAIDTENEKSISYRGDERFAFASTYKALAAGTMLKQKSVNELDEIVTYSKDDLVTYSPITEKHVDTGMSLREIADAAIRYSDNTAGNLLFNEIGGPEGFEKTLREIGDTITLSERTEPNLNLTVPGNSRDTSTPKALTTSLQAFIVGDKLSFENRELLTEWLVGSTTGDTLIRAGVPEEWIVGDKSGAASYGTRNDIAVVWPPDRSPIFIAILSDRTTEDATYDDALIAEAAKIIINQLK